MPSASKRDFPSQVKRLHKSPHLYGGVFARTKLDATHSLNRNLTLQPRLTNHSSSHIFFLSAFGFFFFLGVVCLVEVGEGGGHLSFQKAPRLHSPGHTSYAVHSTLSYTHTHTILIHLHTHTHVHATKQDKQSDFRSTC